MKGHTRVLTATLGFLVTPAMALAQCQSGMVQSGAT
jgi:hypothetical protein